MVGADHIFDAGQGISVRLTARAGPRHQVDEDTARRIEIDRHILAAATVEDIGAEAAYEDVVVGVAEKRVVPPCHHREYRRHGRRRAYRLPPRPSSRSLPELP